jgi:ATP-dependent DNA helicase RecG
MTLLTFQELWSRLRTGDESASIEAKRAEEFGKSAFETISAFSNEPNQGGGYFLLGVATNSDRLFNEYEMVGVPNADKIQSDVASACRQAFSSVIRPAISIETVDKKNVVVVHIPEAKAHDKPIYIKSRRLEQGAFRRIGSTDQLCTDDDIAMFYQLRDHKTYDETLIDNTDVDDFDSQAIEEYRRARAALNPTAEELRYKDPDLLYALNAVGKKDPRVTLAGLRLFGKQMSLRRHFPLARVDYIRVDGREWVPDPDERYQTVEMNGPLLTLIPKVVSQVLSDIPKAFSLTDDELHRREVPLIPRTVIREAIVNALMHRSYRMRQPIQIIKYTNRIEMRNPGHSLVRDDRLGEPGSLTRNEKIAAVLHEVGLAETKGTGIRGKSRGTFTALP